MGVKWLFNVTWLYKEGFLRESKLQISHSNGLVHSWTEGESAWNWKSLNKSHISMICFNCECKQRNAFLISTFERKTSSTKFTHKT